MYVCMNVCRGYGCIHIGYVNVCLYEYLYKYVYTYVLYVYRVYEYIDVCTFIGMWAYIVRTFHST